jgi:hypothetical protein
LIYQNHTNHNCKITLDTGESYNVYSQWLSNEKLFNWKGWECNAGVTRLYITASEEVYSAVCQHDRLGDMSTGWEFPATSTICRRDTCFPNTDDLLTFKQQVTKE